MDFVEAARLRGESLIWIVLNEILPNALAPLIAEFALRFGFAVLFLSSLSFLGLGIQPPEADYRARSRHVCDGNVLLHSRVDDPGRRSHRNSVSRTSRSCRIFDERVVALCAALRQSGLWR